MAQVIIGDPGAGGQTQAAAKELVADAVDVCRVVAIHGLAVHRLPQRAALYAALIEP